MYATLLKYLRQLKVPRLSTDANGNVTGLVGGDGDFQLSRRVGMSGVPMIIPSSGSMANNGVITLSAALPRIYNTGCFLYLPANAIYAGSLAGMYYTVMSTYTIGTVYNNTYTGGSPAIPASATPFVSTGPGAYAQTGGADINLISLTVPAGVMGPNGMLKISFIAAFPANTNNKNIKHTFGSSVILNEGFTNAAGGQIKLSYPLFNQGVANAQISSNFSADGAIGNNSMLRVSADTTQPVALNFAAQLAPASLSVDYLVYEAFMVEAFFQ